MIFPNQDPSSALLYAALVGFLDETRASSFELELLPSSYPLAPSGHPPVPLLIDGAALAIRQADLVRAYLHARTVFFRDSPADAAPASHADASSARFAAAGVLLLLHPEHLTAANYRKRALLARRDAARRSRASGGREAAAAALPPLVARELALTAALLTSPLARHPRSPTLWAHRAWVLRTFRAERLQALRAAGPGSAERAEPADDGDPPDATWEVAALETARAAAWAAELDVVLGAAERHGANYHAFMHGRRALAALWPSREQAGGARAQALRPAAAQVRAWCLAHPRDTSGWTFLAHVLRLADDAALAWEARAAVERFAADVRWEGASVQAFLHTLTCEDGAAGGTRTAEEGHCTGSA